MKKIILAILFSLISISVYAKDNACSNKAIIPEVQVQDNGWLKIVDQYVETLTAEEFYGEHLSEYDKGKKIRKLKVKIQFLKPCVATTKWDEYIKKHSKTDDTDEILPIIGEEGNCIKLLTEQMEQAKQQELDTRAGKMRDYEKEELLKKKLIKKCPDWMDYYIPRFRCNYKYKIFLTQFNSTKYKEFETANMSFFPEATLNPLAKGWLDRKTEMLPGETMLVDFIISDDVKSWCAWLPK